MRDGWRPQRALCILLCKMYLIIDPVSGGEAGTLLAGQLERMGATSTSFQS